ncbi:FAD-dependent monooxygenase [Mycolicibacterium sp. A43C]
MGDAIHAMSPALDMGANTALRDAGLLTHALSSSPSDIVDALSAYHHEMADYAFSQVDASQKIGRARVSQA